MSNADMSALHRNFERRAVPVLPAVAVPTTPQTVAVVDPRVDAILNRLNEQTQLIGRMAENFQKLISNVTVPQMPTRDSLVSGSTHPIVIQEYALDTARTDQELNSIEGNIILAVTDGDLAGVAVRLNERQASPNYFDEHNPIEAPFYKLFLTSNAQSGKTLKLIIGANGLVNLHASPLLVSVRQKFRHIAIYGLAYSSEIEQYFSVDENKTGLQTNKIRITGITVMSSQELHFRLMLFGTDRFFSSGSLLPAGSLGTLIDSAENSFLGEIDLDLPTFGFRKDGAGFYLLHIEGVEIDYTDMDNTRELHLSLQNLSATTKQDGQVADILGAVADDGGVQTDETIAATQNTADDVTLLPAAPAVNDAYYFIGHGSFSGISMLWSHEGDGVWSLSWEYYASDSTWKALSNVVDETENFQKVIISGAIVSEVTWDQPMDMKQITIAGITGFAVRARVSAFASITTQPLASRLYIIGQRVDMIITYEARQ